MTFYSTTTGQMIDERISALDLPMLASVSNMITGGSLRAEDARKVLRMLAESAVGNPGREVIVAGLRAYFPGTSLQLGLAGNFTTIPI